MLIGSDLAEWLDRAAAVLDGADTARRLMASPNFPKDAPAVVEMNHLLSRFGDRDLAERVLWIVNGYTIVAGAQMAALSALCSAREVVFGPIPLVRSALEYSGRVVWLLAESLSPEQRVARVLLEQLRGAEEACKIASRLGGSGADPHLTARAALTNARKEIEVRFPGSIIAGAPSRWKVVDQTLASPTESIEHFGARWGDPREWSGLYDLLSGHSHPSPAIFEMFDVDVDGMPVTTTDRDTVEKLLRIAIVPYYQALRHLQAYTRWRLEPLDSWENDVDELLGVQRR